MMPTNDLVEVAQLKQAFRALIAGVCRVPTRPDDPVHHPTQVEHELTAGVHVKCADRFAAAEHGGGQRNLKNGA
jgi:hypothetical protein